MDSKRCNITDIARMAGVSPATVSRALNDHPYVTQEVHDKIYSAMYRLGYDPRRPVSRKRLAILMSDRNKIALNSYSSSMLFQLMRKCEQYDIAVEMFGTSNLELLSDHFLRVAITFQEFLEEKDLQCCPYTRFITINSKFKHSLSVHSDELQGISLGFETLWHAGHRQLALILPTQEKNQSAVERESAFCQLCKDRGCQFPESRVCFLEDAPVENLARLFMKSNPDGLLLGGEDLVLPVNYALSVLGKRVPDDISLVSYENIFASALMVPPHTTVAQDVEMLAERAVELALHCLNGDKIKDTEVVIPNKIILRDSVSPRVLP